LRPLVLSRLFASLLFSLVLPFPPGRAAAQPTQDLTVSVLTFGPGDHPFFKFGHNALLVHDPSRSPADLVYNYGTFDFGSPGLLAKFFQGKLHYWLSVQSLDQTVAHYRGENRSVDVQELALSPAERRRLVDFLEWNAAPAHREYLYDYYRDNCSTRVRDLVDRATGGRLAAVSHGPAQYTWRQHTLRLTADALPVFFGLDSALGQLVDQPVTQWEEMFLPSKLQESLRRVQVPGATGERALVANEQQIVSARDRAPLRAAPPDWTLHFLVAGSGAGALFAILGWAALRSRAARFVLALALSLTGLALGLFGTLLSSFWLLTDHAAAHHNENVLQFPFFVLGLVVAGAGLGANTDRFRRLAWRICAAAALSSALGLVAKLLSSFDQSNGQLIALMLPLWLGTAIATRLAARATRYSGIGVQLAGLKLP
jgi:hypothetical protein